MAEDFQEMLQQPQDVKDISNDEIIKEINESNETDYLKSLKKKNKNYLVNGLTLLERERIAEHLYSLYMKEKPKHEELKDKIDRYDETYRMVKRSNPGSNDDTPTYVMPLSAVTVEVTHANIMNVFFTPKDVMRVLPTEESDIAKSNKISMFGNWSMDNELCLFEKCDRMFHSSTKIGECPWILHWVKEYGTDIKREILTNPANPSEPLFDPDTKEPLYQEREETKLLYNGPRLEIFSRKDYIQPSSALLDQKPEWEGRFIRVSMSQLRRLELQGKIYKDSVDEVLESLDSVSISESSKEDFEGDDIPLAQGDQEILEFYCNLRINVLKDDRNNNKEDVYQELDDEFIAWLHIKSKTLIALRKNKFPLKERPIGVDYFEPDDDGRRCARGVVEITEGPQTAYDALFNQFVEGTVKSNNPVVFFSPTANQRDEAFKIEHGYAYPSPDPNGVKFFQFPQPNQSIRELMDLLRNWTQMLFGVSDYAAGIESQIDPSAPAKKAELVVAQGSVRLNMVIKRKNKTLREIFRKWFLLYQVNMPPNKFMRITGDTKDNPWKFENIDIKDFQMKSLPDFELTGNVLNVNKQLEANKKLSVYNVLVSNPLFAPNTAQGLQALSSLTKWLIDGLDELGLSRMIPKVPGEMINTPEEENARFLQGDEIEPVESEDHVDHLNKHRVMLNDPNVPQEIKESIIIPHINKTIELMRSLMARQQVMSQMRVPNEQLPRASGEPQGQISEVFPEQSVSVG